MLTIRSKQTGRAALYLGVSLMLLSSSALAADLNSVNSLLDKIAQVLKGAGIAVVTIAFMVAGYKIIFGGSTVREVTPIVIGGIIIGSAAYLAGLIMQ